MAVDPPPFGETPHDEDTKQVPFSWVSWFQSVFDDSNSGFTGSFTNGDGATVTVVNGKITDVS